MPEEEIGTGASNVSIQMDVSSELPFLVTHWLNGYQTRDLEGGASDEVRKEALERVRKATAELASAFSSLGAFGSTLPPSVESAHYFGGDAAEARPASYSDICRRWKAICPPDQLGRLVEAAVRGSWIVDASAQASAPTNLVLASTEDLHERRRNPESGRTLQDAIVLDPKNNAIVAKPLSALQMPVMLCARDTKSNEAAKSSLTKDSSITLASDFSTHANQASECMRRFLGLRDKFRLDEIDIRKTKKSIALQKHQVKKLQEQKLVLNALNGCMDPVTKLGRLDEIAQAYKECERVIAHQERRLETLIPTHAEDSRELAVAEANARAAFSSTIQARKRYRDPLGSNLLRPGGPGNTMLLSLAARRTGMDRMIGRGPSNAMGSLRPIMAREMREDLLKNRLSHAVTINTHLAYPVYCLRFDRTGRYFVTGADDYLVKVFKLGGDLYGARVKDISRTDYARGAILVCTLRGHAGVINDIDVSEDNSFLATASEDGDCRIWGLNDGCPVAILRGHTGGTNMVSWSASTPFRLITAGADGLARTWDIREACLKRYGKMVAKRPEYNHEKYLQKKQPPSIPKPVDPSEASSVAPPPLPVRAEAQGNLPAPPLPVAPPIPAPNGQHQDGANNNQIAPAGRFVANSNMDEGVRLITTHQHGALTNEPQAGGPGTRSRRSMVNVICIARCPHGGHFATGSDDGICRVWRDEDDSAVRIADATIARTKHEASSKVGTGSKLHKSQTGPLMTLTGHPSAVTDLQYSFAGDRLLTASQKDGVVRIWAWGGDPYKVTPKGKQPHILIKLTSPSTGSKPDAPRRGPHRSSTTTVSCDVATWICDDSKIATCQSELVKQTGPEIVPGSHFLCLWDSVTGQCLLGIRGSHTSQCPVVAPHPFDPSIFCTAGADGVVNVWDFRSGKSFYTFKNTVTHGPVESRDRGKMSGFLDGAFHPDGASLVLTDDSGRVSLFDCFAKDGRTNTDADQKNPMWLKEQYFANDYYELYYDANGYCVERGSEQPPHLAPKGVRCSHSGAPFSAVVNDVFKKLVGPLPLSEDVCRWGRHRVSTAAALAHNRKYRVPRNMVCQWDPQTTLFIDARGRLASMDVSATSGSQQLRNDQSNQNRNSNNSSRLSSNYRWRDYDDLLQIEGDANEVEEPDSDYEDTARRDSRGSRLSAADEDSEGVAEGEEENLNDLLEDTPPRPQSRRARSIAADDDDEDSDDDLVEFMSTNNDPSGPFVSDYLIHYFRMSTSSAFLNRAWLTRKESSSSYGGRKSYCPQVGDDVVYIPAAHMETICNFPSLHPPWQNWPQEAVWPVVMCKVRHVRYRFPFKAYIRQCRSIVAKLELEITGIPQLSEAREFDWPAPSFVPPTSVHTFELDLFEKDSTDFLVPAGLYTSRLSQLEEAILASPDGVAIEAWYGDNNAMDLEDAELVPWRGSATLREPQDHENHANLRSSGLGAVVVVWESDESIDYVCPWEAAVVVASSPERPTLTMSEKLKVRKALQDIKHLPGVDEWFTKNVPRRYTDYLDRIEVPMHLTLIAERLDADYYANLYSVVNDVRLIRDNCAKYNSESNNLTHIADGMLYDFEKAVLTEAQITELHEWNKQAERRATERQQSDSDRAPIPRNASVGRANPRRHVGSSLENLPDPDAGPRRSTRQVPARRSDNTDSETATRRRASTGRRDVAFSDQQGGEENEGEGDNSLVRPVWRPQQHEDPRATRRSQRQRDMVQQRDDTTQAEQPRQTLESLSSGGQAQRGRAGGVRRQGSLVQSQAGGSLAAPRRSTRTASAAVSSSNSGVLQASADVPQGNVRPGRVQPARTTRSSGRSSTAFGSALEQLPSDDEVDGEQEERQSSSFRIRIRQPQPSGLTRRSSARQNGRNPDIDGHAEDSSRGQSEATESPAPRRQQPRRGARWAANGGSVLHAEDSSQGQSETEESPPPRRQQPRRGAGSSAAPTPPVACARRTGATSQRRSRRSTRQRAAASEDEADESDDHLSLDSPVGRTRRRSGQKMEDFIEASDESEEEESDTAPPPRRRSLRSRRNGNESATSRTTCPGSGSRSSNADSSSTGDTMGARRSGRSRAAKKPPSSSSSSSDSEDEQASGDLSSGTYHESSAGSVENTQVGNQPPKRKASRGSAKAKPDVSDSPRRSSRAAGRHQATSYADPSSSEFDSATGDSESEPESEPEPARKRRKAANEVDESRGNKRRRSRGDFGSKESKRRKRGKPKPVIEKPRPWPDIDLKAIGSVSTAIIERLSQLDEENVFERPVAEAYPEIAEIYANEIEEPMDFRTIMEERVHRYQAIRELQDDLFQTFFNCIHYNGKKHHFSAVAESMIEMLEETFVSVCAEQDVLLPRRWKSA